MPPIVNEQKCEMCGICYDVCPSDVFYGTDLKEYPKITYPDECWHCGACMIECPKGALRLEVPLRMRPHVVKVV